MSALDELLRSWRANPDANATIALCTALGSANRPDLMKEVRGVAEQWHAGDARVMLCVGQMFLEAGAFVEAQAAFVAAGKADGREPDAFRYLGEVLLRRGDAARAEKVFERALRLAPTSADLRLWQERARMFSALQARVGMEAVAAEVARVVPRPSPEPSSPLKTDPAPPPSGVSPAPGPVLGAPPPLGGASLGGGAPFSGGTPLGGLTSLGAAPPLGAAAPSPLGAGASPAPSGGSGWTAPVESAAAKDVGAGGGAPKAASGDAEGPAEILAELARVGVFEAQDSGAPTWEKAPRQKNRSVWVLAGAAVLVGAGAVGAVVYARDVAARKVAEAAALGDEVSRALAAGTAESIASTDEQLSRAFELDPNSPRTARLWLENRVLHWLVRGAPEGIEGAIQRVRRLGGAPEEVAFGTIAVRLAEGDVPAALAVLPTVDDKAKGDAHYQLLAGLALERVGDAGCLDRYEAAVSGAQDLRVARVLWARALLSMRGPEQAQRALEGIDAASAEGRALGLLGAALAPLGSASEGASSEGGEAIAAETLPVVLRWIPGLWRARQALAAGQRDEGTKLLAQALATVDTPDGAVRIGELALAAGSPDLVQKAALQAISLSPVHGPARLLAARAATEMGRYDEALQALANLEGKQPAALELRAVIAYEKGDAVTLGDLVDASKDAAPPVVRALPTLLVGGTPPKELSSLDPARAEILWGRLALVDAAIVGGRLTQAKELLAAAPASAPPVARRLAQIARLENRTEDALAAGARAFSGAPTSLSLIEHALGLLAAGQPDRARELADSHGTLLGPLAPWLVVLADVEQGRAPRAKARAATLPEPPQESPLALRLVVTQGLVAVGDRARGRALLEQLRRQAPRHPEVARLPARL